MRIALLFPGQGSQYVGMGKKWFDQWDVARQTFEESDEALGFALSKLCFEGDPETLTATEFAQPAILTASIAAYRVYKYNGGLTPDYLAGHSLGEISALVVSGAISFADAVRLVRLRGSLMTQSLGDNIGAMIAVSGCEEEQVRKLCRLHSTDESIAVISNYNSPNQLVVSGNKLAVERVEGALKKEGGEVVYLKVSAPFHSPLMEEAAHRFEEALKTIKYSDLQIPVISNIYAKPYQSKETIVELLSRQIVEPVRWNGTMKFLVSKGIDTAVELGPKKILKNLFKNYPSVRAFSFDLADDVEQWSALSVPEVQSERESKMKLISRCLAIAVCTRNRNWDNEAYERGVLMPYRRIKVLEEQLETTGREPNYEELEEAMDMLRSVFETKLTPEEEQRERFEQLMRETNINQFQPNFIDMTGSRVLVE
ncbi:ACP S-malonyltransferase [Paenibacillus sp. 2TAF8]|jgi:[acyl-carrier-protein] S-malonyltransferase|uniref:ACP S-malonyltransferase n=1 Tax=Paenibacillus sp. 2TAF8 TaxID=3233020 RepID=UPI003F9DBF1E